MYPRAVLFDFDGVIVDSFTSHYGAWKLAFEELFQSEIAPFPHDTHAGKAPIIIAEYFCSQIGQASKAQELFELKGNHLHANSIPPGLLPGVREIQAWLQAKEIPYGIASNATRAFVKNSVQQLNIHFKTCFGFEDYKYPKPHPEPYLLLAETLGVPKEENKDVWVFEDSLTGTKAAKQAGMIPIGIMTQYSKEELQENGSELVFPTLKEAWQYLENL